MTNNKNIFFASSIFSSPFSTSIDDLERLNNALITYNTIGKLVRFENENSTPYLASKWDTTGETWTFHLHKGLKCENNEKITPTSFKKSITRTLRSQLKHKRIPIFEDLIGFDTFKQSLGEIEGIVANEDSFTLSFNFSKKIKSGLLEYLSMSPFGYICNENFDQNNSWIDNKKIISSGAYKLVYDKEKKLYKNVLRENWPLSNTKMLNEITFTSKLEDIASPENSIIQDMNIPDNWKKKLIEVQGIPMTLYTLSLLKNNNGYFSELNNRLAFHQEFNKIQKDFPFNSQRVNSTPHFYTTIPFSEKQLSIKDISHTPAPYNKLKVRGYSKEDQPWQKYLNKIVTKTLNSLNWEYELITTPVTSYSDLFNSKHDIRIMGSEIGASPVPWGIKMLFCSEIGPHFSDPESRICNLVDDFDHSNMTQTEFTIRFNEELIKQMGLIPILNKRYIWNIGYNLSPDSFSPLTSIPQFDLIEVKK